MAARFMPGVRTVTYFTAGSVGMRYWKFALYDSIAALASAPLFVVLGYKFGGNIDALIERIAAGERGVIIGIIVLVVAAVLFSRWRSRREALKTAAALTRKAQIEGVEPVPPASE